MGAVQFTVQIMPFERKSIPGGPSGASGGDDRRTAAGLRIRLHQRMEPLEERWRRLEAENVLSLHQGYDWCHAWARSRGCRLLIAEGIADGQTQFLLPLEIAQRGPARIARFLGTRFSNINTGLYTPGLHALAARMPLRRAFDEARDDFARHFDLFLLEKVPLDWRGETTPFSGLPAARNQNTAFQLPLHPDFEQTLAQISARHRRKKFRVSERRLMALGGYDHVIAGTARENRLFLEAFFQQKAVRFDTMGLPDVFRDAATRDFFRTLADLPQKADAYPLRLHAIRLKGRHEGRIAAIAGLSRKGDHVICQFGSIDEGPAAPASPGELLFHLIIQRLCGEDVRLFDFGIGDQPYKRSWCSVETTQHDLLWPVTPTGSAVAMLHRSKAAAKRLIKRSPPLYSFLQRLRSG